MRRETDSEVLSELVAVEEHGEAALQGVASGYALYRGYSAPIRGARSFNEEQAAELVEDGGPMEERGGLGSQEPIEELESVGEAEEAAEVEEIEPLAETDEAAELAPVEAEIEAAPVEMKAEVAAAGSPEAADFMRRLIELIEKGRASVSTLEETVAAETPSPAVVEADDGVLQIREEVMHSEPKGDNQAFKQLVDAVVSGEEAASDNGSLGLFPIPSVELAVEGMTPKREPPIPSGGQAYRGAKQASGAMSVKDGFNYDQFRSSFKPGAIGTMKSLMRVSQNADAIYAALLLDRNGGLAAEFSLGLDQRTMASFVFGPTEPIYTELFLRKRIVYLRTAATGLPEFDAKILSKDLRFMKGSLYLPVVFEEKPAYLFLGLKDTTHDVRDYLPESALLLADLGRQDSEGR